ncbi:amyloid-beta A4 precursor protein-binding family B member 3-like, partial [Cyanistes caeruleus]|uniref:amyloid-beta A4 precursor protein-binding family B member 3-like n=1 Tax=Cyanistes caeruleus TaxID=156563 RepID=UPI000CDAE1D5
MFPRQAPLPAHAPSHAPRCHRRNLSLLGKAVGSSGQLRDLPPHPVSHAFSPCTDNLWSDQSLETDPDLPPSWRKICDSLGTYYWHVPTGTTQWQHPARTTGPGGHTEADGEETLQGRECQGSAAKHSAKDRPIPSPMASLSRRHSLSWHGDDFQHSAEPGSKCFAVRSLGWVEIPEEDLAPGKSSIAVNNCIQQLSNSKGQGSAENQGEGQDLVMILKKDTMSLVDPLDRSLIHRQPILNIRVWGVGCNNGRCH